MVKIPMTNMVKFASGCFLRHKENSSLNKSLVVNKNIKSKIKFCRQSVS